MALVLGACGMALAHGATVEPVTPCFAAAPPRLALGAKVDCGYVVVPEDAAVPGGRQIKLGFLRLQARKPSKQAPMFMLSGGPGSSLIAPTVYSLFAPQLLGPLLDTRDVVVLDQRGTRHALPFLGCPQSGDFAWNLRSQGLSPEARAAVQRRELERCIAGARQQGVDLSKYNSVAIAHDVDAARRALGYERIVYYGASYGSQLGQHVMREHPAMLESVILDGTNSLSRKSWIEDRALDIDFAIGHLDALCRSQPKCAASYDIPALIDRGIAVFDAGPIPVTYTDPKDPSASLKFELTRMDFLSMVYERQGDKIGVSSLPYILTLLLADGRRSMGDLLGQLVGQQLLAQRRAGAGALATLMHIAVVCSDDPVRSTDELVLAGVKSRYAILMGQAMAQEYVGYCNTIGVPSLPDSTDVDITSAIPTLILSGGLDVATPTFRSEVVAKSLPNGRMVVFADGTHVQVAAVNLCAMQILRAFVADPLGPLPLKCVSETRFPGFTLPDGTMSQ